MSTKPLYTSEDVGSGQSGICAKCLLGPTQEGHDGCLGELPWPVMNACCGHGNDRQAYIQYWTDPDAIVRGSAAVSAQRAMVAARKPQGGEDE